MKAFAIYSVILVVVLKFVVPAACNAVGESVESSTSTHISQIEDATK